MADTGQGASLTLATSGTIGVIRSMTLPEFVIEKIESTGLATTAFKTFIPSDLSDPGELTAEIIFDAENGDVVARGVPETVTVTWPVLTTGQTAANLAGTGFVTAFKLPDMSTGELQIATITIAFDGLTDPAFTAESA